MRYIRNALAAACVAALVPAFAATTAGATAAPRSGSTVADATIIQGLPKTSVDVYVNGTEIVQDFRFKGVVGPLPLLPGKYHIAIRLHGAKQGSPPLLSRTGWLVAGENVTLVADLDPAGAPALTFFCNPDPTLAKGRAMLIVRNVAADNGLNVYAYGLRIFRDLASPAGGRIRLPSEWVRIRMTLFGSSATAVGPTRFHLSSQTVTIDYAIGSAAGGTLTSVQQSYPISQ